MKGNPRVIEYLNKALTHELTAVNQYWLHYRFLEDWGYTRLAVKERKESIEEMQHADKLVARMNTRRERIQEQTKVRADRSFVCAGVVRVGRVEQRG